MGVEDANFTNDYNFKILENEQISMILPQAINKITKQTKRNSLFKIQGLVMSLFFN